MIRIDWEKFTKDYVLFGQYRFYTWVNIRDDKSQCSYTWGTFTWDLHKNRPWHKCYKIND